jgi:hypothetical protein
VESKEEAAIVQNMMFAVEEGQLESQIYVPDISVAAQQIFSYLYQHKEGASDTEILDLVSPLCCEGDGLMMLDYLEQKGWLAFHRDKWTASTKLMDRGEKGHIHSNIPTSLTLRVVDVDSGKEIGQISRRFSNVFVLGHRQWQVVSTGDKSVKVRRFKGEARPAKFKSTREMGAYAFFLPKELRPMPDSILGDLCPGV